MRADARANRDALLAAARTLYAARGTSVPFSAIAAEAGVGIATLYRHFPTPDDLVLGLLEQMRDQVVEVCHRHRPGMIDQPTKAWPAFVADLVDLEIGALLPQLVAGRELDELPAGILAIRAAVLAEVSRVLDRAKAAGLVAADIPVLYFQAGIGAFTRPIPPTVESQLPGLRAWLTEVYLAGLRSV